MTTTNSPLKIHVHLTDGRLHTYVHGDPDKARQFLDGLHPRKVFAEPQILIAGEYTVTGYRCSAITRIDLVLDGMPDWSFPNEVAEIREMSEQAFLQKYQPGDEDASKRRQRSWKPGEPVEAFAEFELAGGKKVFMEYLSVREQALEQRAHLQHFIEGPITGRRLGGGVLLLNPANVLRWTIFPGPPEAPRTAWSAHFLSELTE